MMGQYVNDNNLVDWDEPHGEMSVGTVQSSGDTGENNRSSLVHWLQTERGYTLASLGQAWHHDPRFFAAWSQVPIPNDYSLLGADKNSLFADRTWRLLVGVVGGDAERIGDLLGQNHRESVARLEPAAGNERVVDMRDLRLLRRKSDRALWRRSHGPRASVRGTSARPAQVPRNHERGATSRVFPNSSFSRRYATCWSGFQFGSRSWMPL